MQKITVKGGKCGHYKFKDVDYTACGDIYLAGKETKPANDKPTCKKCSGVLIYQVETLLLDPEEVFE